MRIYLKTIKNMGWLFIIAATSELVFGGFTAIKELIPWDSADAMKTGAMVATIMLIISLSAIVIYAIRKLFIYNEYMRKYQCTYYDIIEADHIHKLFKLKKDGMGYDSWEEYHFRKWLTNMRWQAEARKRRFEHTI